MGDEKESTSFLLECECGCCLIKTTHYPCECLPEENTIFISYFMDKWYSEVGIIESLIKRIKLAWKILINGRYFLYEIGVKESRLEAYRNFINECILVNRLK